MQYVFDNQHISSHWLFFRRTNKAGKFVNAPYCDPKYLGYLDGKKRRNIAVYKIEMWVCVILRITGVSRFSKIKRLGNVVTTAPLFFHNNIYFTLFLLANLEGTGTGNQLYSPNTHYIDAIIKLVQSYILLLLLLSLYLKMN